MPFRISHVVPFALAATLLTSSKLAAGNAADAKAQYKKDRAACQTLASGKGRDTCLEKAAAAYKKARSWRAQS